MQEETINQQLKNVKRYLGSYAIDELNDIFIDDVPSFAIINLGTRNSSGSHWIAVAFYLNEVYICDSLGGLLPDENFPKKLINFLDIFTSTRKIYMTRRLQKLNSITCGAYCVFFVKLMSEKNSFCNFLSYFTSDKKQNDNIISLLIKQ